MTERITIKGTVEIDLPAGCRLSANLWNSLRPVGIERTIDMIDRADGSRIIRIHYDGVDFARSVEPVLI